MQADIPAAVLLLCHAHDLAYRDRVRRLHDRDLRNAAHDRDVLKRHVGAAVERGRDAGVGADDLDILLGIGTGDKDLVAGAARRKGRERMGKRDLSGRGQSWLSSSAMA